MPTNLELLKSIYENGKDYVLFESFGKCVLYDVDREWIESGVFTLKGNKFLYRIPSELEVEKKIVELAKQQGIWESLEHKEEFGESNYHESLSEHVYQLNPAWDIDNDCSFVGNSYLRESHESRLTSGLMLWDKLLKEKR